MEQPQENHENNLGTVNVQIKEYIDDQMDKKWRRWIWAGMIVVLTVMIFVAGLLSLKSLNDLYATKDILHEAETRLTNIQKIESQLFVLDSLQKEEKENSLYSGFRHAGCDGKMDYRPGLDQLLAQKGFTHPTPESEDSLNALLTSGIMCDFSAAKFVYFENLNGSTLRRVGVSYNGLPPHIIDILRENFQKYFKNADVRFFEESKLPTKTYVYFISRIPSQ